MMQMTLGEICVTSTLDAASILETLEQRYAEDAHRHYEEELKKAQKAGSEALARQSAEHEKAMAEAKADFKQIQAAVAQAQMARLQDRVDLDSANGKQEALAKQMHLLLATQQQDILDRLKDSVEYGRQQAELRHREITLGLIIILLSATIAGSGIFPDELKLIFLLASLIISVVSGLAFYKNPEKLFGKHLERVRQIKFEKRAKELHVAPRQTGFVIDLEVGTVVPSPEEGRPKG
jgi:hypothetical protein